MTNADIPSVSNVLAVYNGASADAIRQGLSWYLDAHNVAILMAKEFSLSISQAAGIIAALSPLNGWENNKRKALQLCRQGGRVSIDENGGNGIGLGKNVAKAQAIFFGANPEDVLSGDKVNAFYRTILDPHGDIRPTIDRHAFDIAVGERTDEKRRGALSRKGVYEAFADVYREAAKIAGIGAAQMQAVTWVAWREALGIDA